MGYISFENKMWFCDFRVGWGKFNGPLNSGARLGLGALVGVLQVKGMSKEEDFTQQPLR